MVTGRVPFEGETPLGIAMKHKSENPQDPREFNAQIPDDLSRVILRYLEKDKESRYQSAGEVRATSEDVEKAREGYERIIARPTGRLHYGDIYAKSFYLLGKIHEQQGNTAKAIKQYEI
jgi:serine/threonine protein kinase